MRPGADEKFEKRDLESVRSPSPSPRSDPGGVHFTNSNDTSKYCEQNQIG